MEIVNSGYSEAQLVYLLEHLFDSPTSLDFITMRADVVAALNRLPLEPRAMLAYHAMGFSDAEIADRLRVSYTRRTLQRMRMHALLRLLVEVNLGRDDGRKRVSDEGASDSGAA